MQLFIPCLAASGNSAGWPGVPAFESVHIAPLKWTDIENPADRLAGKPLTGKSLIKTAGNKVRFLRKTSVSKRNKKGPGPGQPEQKSFQSVNKQNMVDLFTGDFSYNIPLLDVGGYPITIHYRGGVTMDQEASWVGLGWNCQPGSINRNMRGIPDDFRGDTVTKKEYSKPNWTAGIELGASPEIYGLPIDVGLSAGLFYNNYRGIGFETGLNVSLNASKGAQGGLNSGIGINVNNNSQNGFSIEPSFNIGRMVKENSVQGISTGFNVGASISTRNGMKDMSFSMTGTRLYADQDDDIKRGSTSGVYSSISFAHQSYTPRTSVPFTSFQYNFSIKLGGEAFGFHPLASLGGYYSKQYIEKSDSTLYTPAYGYMYLQEGYANPNSLQDFNREKELPAYSANPPTPHLPVPNYTYDIYSITGEGTGGMFRPYRGDISYVRDPVMQSKSSSDGASVDLGAGDIFHAGVDVRLSYTNTTTGGWTTSNNLALQNKYRKADSTFENVYFRNPSEKTTNEQSFYDKTGDTKVLLPVMTAGDDPTLTPTLQPYVNFQKSGTPLNFDGSILKKSRDKRSQVISFLTAYDASHYGLDKFISNHTINEFLPNNCYSDTAGSGVTNESRWAPESFRKYYHFSEITVLNGDGKRYVYGLPVYNLDQEEVSFSVNKSGSNIASLGNIVKYDPLDNSSRNDKGKDNFYTREKIPAYASSFLITGLLSSDYVDRTGDGITDDDQGDAVKFSYSKLYGSDNPYRWRTPYDTLGATYQEGLRTDTSDDKGSYIYGTKEIWYLNSVMTKTMIATFTLNDPAKGEVRQDDYGVKDENGGIDTTHSLRYLKQIDLYSKADYLSHLQKGTTPRPIKTVHFVYSYTLCKGAPGSRNGNGKLTLDSIWFSYNGNEKGHQNPYVFRYNSNNPSYNSSAFDRWGNYKDPASNPGGLSNADFPYVLQDSINNWDSAQAAANAGAWNLDSIKLPSSGTIKVDYESDDYAYVQNKRAAEMMELAGFGSTSSNPSANLYNGLVDDYSYVFIRVPKAVNGRSDVYQKYLDGIDKIYFTYRVKMPSDVYGSGYEHIAVYAQYDDYGVTAADKYIIWIHMKSAEGSGPYVSPLAKAAIQALRLDLPSKAFPGSDLNGEYDPVALGKSLVGYIANFGELITNFPNRMRIAGTAKQVDLDASFARLDAPDYKKFGGGLRVKRITISDHFNDMTNGQMKTSVYGQEYDYTTYKTINGLSTRISSGVAAWEPAVGNEENPFHTPIEYDVQVSALAPASDMYSEYPLGEGYFPAPQVGYSKVRVHTINNKTISANGYEESEFYTTYDFPTITEQTPLDTRRFKPSFLSNLFKINARSYLTQTQGFKVEINDMNGKEKATASYPENDPYNPVSYTQYFYKMDNDSAVSKHLNNTVAVVDSASGHINPSAQVGKDVEVMIDFREENTQTKGVDVEANVDGFIIGIIPIAVPMVWPFPQAEVERYRSAATMKLVQRYGILDKILHYEKGSLITTENLLFDAETGDPILTRTKNEFDDSVYQFTYPAHWAYSGMEPAYKNTGAVFYDLKFDSGRITSSPGYSNIEKDFESGDEILFKGTYYKTSLGSTTNPCTGEGTCASPIWSTDKFTKIWAIDASRIQDNKGYSGMYFMDSWGRFFTSEALGSGAHDTVMIIRSGKRNMASAAVGSVQSLASPMRQVSGKWKLVFDDQARVINTSATKFSDFWKVENTNISISRTVIAKTKSNQTKILYPTKNLSLNWYDPKGDNFGGIGSGNYNTDFVESESWFRHVTGGYNDGVVASWLEFPLADSIPAGAEIITASLNLWPHLETHTITPNTDEADLHNHTATDPHYINLDGLHNESLVGLETSSGITGSDWTTLVGSGNTAAQKNAFFFSTVWPYWSSHIRDTRKQNSVCQIDIGPLVSEAMTTLSTPFILRFFPKYNWHATDDGHGHNTGRMCFWATDTSEVIYKGLRSGESFLEKDSYPQPGHNVSPALTINYTYCPPGTTQEADCDTVYCVSTSSTTNCISAVKDTTVNPYVYGILGNWRPERSYVYYDNRKETDPAQQTDIRNNGTLIDYQPFWSFTSGKLSAATDTSKWVWNSESTLFNKRGLELENRNALNIYNSAQYGYAQSLPVAVTQNAAYKEQAYEGFEDYSFPNSQQTCQSCTVVRHVQVDSIATNLTTDEAHTGKYSLFVSPGDSISVSGNISLNEAALPDTLAMKIDTTVVSTFNITNSGTGLADTIYRYGPTAYNADNLGVDAYNYDHGTAVDYGASVNNINYDGAYPPGSSNPIGVPQYEQNYKVVWQGYFLADQDFNSILFNASATNSLKVWMAGIMNISGFSNDPDRGLNLAPPAPGYIHSKRGIIYPIRVEHTVGAQTGHLSLQWINDSYSSWGLIPSKYLYPTLASAQTALNPVNTSCRNWNGLIQKNMVYDELSPVAGSKMVVSVWVKEQQDCHCNSYKHANIRFNFKDPQGNVLGNEGIGPVYPSGNIIDGWQRIEAVITLPVNASSFQVNLENDNSDDFAGKVYFDDLRIHPFNGSMKSYVYDDISLRLMAELDENNYASFYEYDDDGSLVRVKKETEQGIKTIKETRDALIKDLP